MGKGEIAHDEQFLLFPQCFLLNQIVVYPFVHILDIISLFAAEFKKPKIGISGNLGLSSTLQNILPKPPAACSQSTNVDYYQLWEKSESHCNDYHKSFWRKRPNQSLNQPPHGLNLSSVYNIDTLGLALRTLTLSQWNRMHVVKVYLKLLLAVYKKIKLWTGPDWKHDYRGPSCMAHSCTGSSVSVLRKGTSEP